MCQDIHYLTKLLQSMNMNELRSQGIIQDGGQGVHEGC